MTQIFKPFMSATIRYFHYALADEARRWLAKAYRLRPNHDEETSLAKIKDSHMVNPEHTVLNTMGPSN